MNRNIVLELFLIALVALFLIPGALTLPQYLAAYNSTFNTNASCAICHVNPAGGGPRNSYGQLFESQPNHATDPSAALRAIGPAPGATSTVTVTITETVTPIITVTVIPITTVTVTPTITATGTPTATMTEIPTETPIATPITTPIITPTVPVTTTAAPTPGFEVVASLAGLLLIWAFLGRRSNK